MTKRVTPAERLNRGKSKYGTRGDWDHSSDAAGQWKSMPADSRQARLNDLGVGLTQASAFSKQSFDNLPADVQATLRRGAR